MFNFFKKHEYEHKHVDSLNEEERIDHDEKDNTLLLRERTWALQIHPDKIRDFFHRHEIFFGYILLIFVSFLVFGNFLKVKAELAIFYPQTCLGGWENVYKAQGLPETKGNFFTTDFSEENSAILYNRNAQIFCGEFAGEIPQDSIPKKFVLKLAVKIVDEPLPIKDPFSGINDVIQNIENPILEVLPAPIETEIIINNSSSSAEVLPTTESDIIIPTEDIILPTENSIIPETVPTVPTVPISEAPIISMFRYFSKVAFAQNEENISDIVIPQEDLSVNTTTTINTTIDINTITNEIPPTQEVPLDQSLIEIVSQININEDITSVDEKPENFFSIAEHDDLFSISYTLDGVNWQVLGTIQRTNLTEVSFDIPLENLSWDSVSKIQISISPFFTIDKMPIVYLDGMQIETEYENIQDADLLLSEGYRDSEYNAKEELILPIGINLQPNTDKSVSAHLKNGMEDIILVPKIIKKYHYFIFSPLDRISNGGFCAKLNGREWITDLESMNYGTCFINDTGDFEILELSEDIGGGYNDLKLSEFFVNSFIFNIKAP